MTAAPRRRRRAPTDGSDRIIRCARRPEPRPLYVLVWGGIKDVAQAPHDAPDVLPKLRVYFIIRDQPPDVSMAQSSCGGRRSPVAGPGQALTPIHRSLRSAR